LYQYSMTHLNAMVNPNSNREHNTFDIITNRDVEFQHSVISIESIKSQEETTDTDWIFDVTDKYTCIWCDLAVCEIPNSNWENAVKACNNNVILCTGKKEWILLEDRESYTIEIEGKKRNVWIGKIITIDDVIQRTCLKNMFTEEGKKTFSYTDEMDETNIIYARCKKSMKLLDPIFREHVIDIEYEKDMVYAIKSVAGSGKTTTLLKLADVNKDKKILYLAFNRAIVKEIQSKRKNNMTCKTFDSLIMQHSNINGRITNLTPYTFNEIYPWLKKRPFKMKQGFIDKYNKFCKDTKSIDMKEFIKLNYRDSSDFTKKHLNTMWNDTLEQKFITFDALKKLAFISKSMSCLDDQYDMVFIDEAQDFDPIMLDILLRDTTIPKVFVGDPRQAIYEWRGAVNSFDNLPYDSHVVEFYTSFRIGNPACEEIRGSFEECWMTAGTDSKTMIYHHEVPGTNYHYLFRKWRSLLTCATEITNIWINDFDNQRTKMERLHTKLQKYKMTKEEQEDEEDDLPKFLREMTEEELADLMNSIEDNLVHKEDAEVCMYTIHSYKGMEHENIRIFNDINIEKEENLYYVALTRGINNIYMDTNI